ncbi:hypothetical protein N7509_002766 [Penicillium cosmopolitanum]|uniref:Uncharacterized protein n=1 Tax=Penicillium cosmopolitanum TaxID=1131564 RepID=A0A9X0BDM5_9EURO|nr:uncharacterized protein N7509_002766 [Penicillium cosmopolitanum]KAJ5408883.1 hypothetical protein N7509_002766 [Penicillium cosmopolitanum]
MKVWSSYILFGELEVTGLDIMKSVTAHHFSNILGTEVIISFREQGIVNELPDNLGKLWLIYTVYKLCLVVFLLKELQERLTSLVSQDYRRPRLCTGRNLGPTCEQNTAENFCPGFAALQIIPRFLWKVIFTDLLENTIEGLFISCGALKHSFFRLLQFKLSSQSLLEETAPLLVIETETLVFDYVLSQPGSILETLSQELDKCIREVDSVKVDFCFGYVACPCSRVLRLWGKPVHISFLVLSHGEKDLIGVRSYGSQLC